MNIIKRSINIVGICIIAIVIFGIIILFVNIHNKHRLEIRRIAFSLRIHNRYCIYTAHIRGNEDCYQITTRKIITDKRYNCSNPTFSPDGKFILFESDRDGDSDIYRMDANGQHIIRISQGNVYSSSPSYSPDGYSIIFSASHEQINGTNPIQHIFYNGCEWRSSSTINKRS